MKKLLLLFFILSISAFMSCDDDVPEEEQSTEIITRVRLLFSPAGGGAPIVVDALDADGLGPGLVASGQINLQSGESYELFISLENRLTDEDITEEVRLESNEHMLFFGFSSDLFESPDGDGNLEDRAASVNYLDQDANNLPLGLITSWIAGDNASSGNFRIVLKHQPDGIKTATSESTEGATDIDVTWPIAVD
ncbi:MAG: hypothetical protein RIC35_15230 [Marinoscillum sp.]